MRSSFLKRWLGLCAVAAIALAVGHAAGQAATQSLRMEDSDSDGLSDALEQRLLDQFAPKFMIATNDCSVSPAEFKAGMKTPLVEAENGTIYGQVSPIRRANGEPKAAEIHFYHLWRKDCGLHGHALDTEHVAVLVQASDVDLAAAKWRAVYWYAAAHENTVCDVSQIARAKTLHAEDHGATVWVSPGKHASYLNERLCHGGCGADRCEDMAEMKAAALVNVGEPGHPMNDSIFIASSAWPLLAKMSTSNFPAAPVARLNALPETNIAWFNTGRHAAQGIIARSSATEQAIAGGGRSTISALSLANDASSDALSTAGSSTNSAISTASGSTGNALEKSYKKTRHALGISARHVGEALRITPKESEKKPE